jgi:hypothetical protein
VPTSFHNFRVAGVLVAALLTLLVGPSIVPAPAAAAGNRVDKHSRAAGNAAGLPVRKKAHSSHRGSPHSSATDNKSASHRTPGRGPAGNGGRSKGGRPARPSQPGGGSSESIPTTPAPIVPPVLTEPAPEPTESTPPPTPPTQPVETTPAPTETTPSTSACPIGKTTTEGSISMTMPGCRVVASDTSAQSNQALLWGALQCASAPRYAWGTTEGDTHPTASGAAQGDGDFRQLTAIDGDDFWGERCELGRDDWRTGPTAYYREGDHYVTYISERLPSNFPLSTRSWQTVMQMKQAQPSDGGGGGPIIEMEARENRWVIGVNWVELFSFPAKANQWTRFAWDVYYSQDPNKGRIQVSADLNGDGDFEDTGERSPVYHVATLKTEIEGPNGASDGIAAGQPIPSHLRAGIYHNPEIPCPASTGGCSVQVDNVQVMAAP